MKTYVLKLALLFFGLSLIFSCEPEISYQLHVEELTNKNAPALQSFAHGTSGSEWLLFAGRTNEKDDDGGLHDMSEKSNYANTSFPPTSYNENIYVYDPIIDAVPTSINISEMLEIVSRKFKSYNSDTINKYKTVFKNTNPLVRQVDEYLYVIGGYGAIDFTKPKNGYITYDHVAKIHVPSMIQLVKGNYAGVKESKLFAFAQNKNLVSTGGELHNINGTFYLITGHNFGKTAANGQKYVDAVYPFSIKPKVVGRDTIKHTFSFSNSTPISDVSDPNGASSDNTSIFRRRDGPITPSLYYNTLEKSIEESIAIYAGVFKPGEDLEAWNDAIYVHPNWAGENNKLYTYDKNYNQKNYNVYASPFVVAYDSSEKIVHTFLLGGIGDGNTSKEVRLSGFTNTGTHIKLNVDSSPLQSTRTVFSNNLFGNSEVNSPPFYGAEAIFFASKGFKSTKVSKEIIDISSTFNGEVKSIEVGYIFGGIEAIKSHPGTYGKTNSRASNKVWKVTLTKQSMN